MMRGAPHFALGVIALSALPGLTACVVEEAARPRQSPLRTAIQSQSPVALPAGPVASPATSAQTSTFRVRLAIKPLGSVPYDGQTLPLVSPDGRFLVTQVGHPPEWTTVLGVPGAPAPMGATRFIVHDLTKTLLAEVPAAVAMPGGLMLGLSCDTTGFLVEHPRDDGSRWIGKASWVSREITWLVNSAHLSSHGVLTTDGSLIFVRREVSGDRAELVIRARDGATSAWSDQSGLIPIYPVVGDDPSVVGCLLGSPQGIELVVLRAALSGPPKFLGLIGRRGIAGVGDPALAYQCVAAAQMPPPQFESKANTLVFFHAGLGRMVNFSVEKGELSLLPERSVAAVRSPLVADSGMFVTTPRGLVYSPDPAPPLPSESRSDGAPRPRPPEARLFDTPHVARATLNPDLPLILLGPVKDSPDPRIAVLVVWAAKE